MSSNFAKRYQDHLLIEHNIGHFSRYLKEIVLGGIDGIVTTFAVVAGFTGANSQSEMAFWTVMLFGFANLFADGASMGLGNFLSIRSEQKSYLKHRAKESHDIKHTQAFEVEETKHLLQEQGFSAKQAQEMTALMQQNETFWLDFMMHYELKMDDLQDEKPLVKGLVTFISFVLFGFLPLTPYFFLDEVQPAFIAACLASVTALIMLGLVRGQISGESLWQAVLEVLLIGFTAGLVAYMVGILVGG